MTIANSEQRTTEQERGYARELAAGPWTWKLQSRAQKERLTLWWRTKKSAARYAYLLAAALFAVQAIQTITGGPAIRPHPWGASVLLAGVGLVGSGLCAYGLHRRRLPRRLIAAFRAGERVGRWRRRRGAHYAGWRDDTRHLSDRVDALMMFPVNGAYAVLLASTTAWWPPGTSALDHNYVPDPVAHGSSSWLQVLSFMVYLACVASLVNGALLAIAVVRLLDRVQWPPPSRSERLIVKLVYTPRRTWGRVLIFLDDLPLIGDVARRERPSSATLTRRLALLAVVCVVGCVVLGVGGPAGSGSPFAITMVVFLVFSALVAVGLRQAVVEVNAAAQSSWATPTQRATGIAKVQVEARAYLWTVGSTLVLVLLGWLALAVSLAGAAGLYGRPPRFEDSAEAAVWRWVITVLGAGLSPFIGVLSLLTVGAIALVISSYKEIATLRVARRPEKHGRGTQGGARPRGTRGRRRPTRVAGHGSRPRISGAFR